jgi:hypothetical protein
VSRRIGGALAIGTLALTLLSGCSGGTTATRSVVICGRTLYSGDAGLFVYSPSRDAVGPHPPVADRVPLVTSSTPVLIQLSTNCVAGVRYSVTPKGLVRAEDQIMDARGGVIAVSLVGIQSGRATLTVLSGPNSGWSQSITVAAS